MSLFTEYKGLQVIEGAVGNAGQALTTNFKTIADRITSVLPTGVSPNALLYATDSSTWSATTVGDLQFDLGTKRLGIGVTGTPIARFSIGASGDTGAANGINIGSDVNLYRLSANVLKTDDALTVIGDCTAGSFNTVGTINGNSLTIIGSSTTGYIYTTGTTGYNYFAGNVAIGSDTTNCRLNIGSSADTASTSGLAWGNDVYMYHDASQSIYLNGKLQVRPSLRTISGNITDNFVALQSSAYKQVQGGANDQGYAIGLYGKSYRNGDATDTGTLAELSGIKINVGHLSSSTSTPQTTNAYGLNIVSDTYAGTISNYYGLYVDSSTGAGTVTNYWGAFINAGKSYFSSNVGIGSATSALTSRLTVGVNTDTSGVGGISFGGDTNLYRSGSGTLKTDGGLAVVQNAAFNAQIAINTASYSSLLSIGTSTATTSASGITFGGDVNLYRSAANVLKTDDALTIIGDCTAGSFNTAGAVNAGSFVGGTFSGTTANMSGSCTTGALAVNGALAVTGNVTSVGNITFATGPRSITSDSGLTLSGGLGTVKIGYANLVFPNADSTAGAVMYTNGSGVLGWKTIALGGSVPASTVSGEFLRGSGGNWIGTDSALTYSASKLYMNGYVMAYLPNQTTFDRSIAFGNGLSLLSSSTTGDAAWNTAVGMAALNATTTGKWNTAVGTFALASNTSGSINCAVGVNALYANTTGGTNNAFGFNALKSNLTGNSNVGVGYCAGYNATTSLGTMSSCTFVGANSISTVDGIGNSMALGNAAQVTASNQVSIGNSSVTAINLSSCISNNGLLNLPSNTVASGGIYFGTDVNLYRSAATTLRTDNALYVGSLIVGSNSTGAYLRNNGTSYVASAIQSADISELTSGSANKLAFYNGNPGIRTAAPSSSSSGALTYAFGTYSNNNAATYADILLLRGYTDTSGGCDNMVSISRGIPDTPGTMGMRIWQQASGSSTAFSVYKDVVLAENGAAANYLTKYSGTGTTVSVNTSAIYETSGNVGIGTTTLTGKLNLPSDTAAAGGIYFGTDVNLYRSAANTLFTNANVSVGLGSASNGSALLITSGGSTNNYVNFADTQLGGQSFGKAFLRWTRDNNGGRKFGVYPCDSGQNTVEGLTVDYTGNVLVPTGYLSVSSGTQVSAATINQLSAIRNSLGSSSNAYWENASTFNIYKQLANGVVDTGATAGVVTSVFRNYGTNEGTGTLSMMYGHQVQYGHFNSSTAAPVTTWAAGIALYPYAQTGTVATLFDLYIGAIQTGATVTNRWGIYQTDTNAPNYLGSSLGIGTTTMTYGKISVVAGTSSTGGIAFGTDVNLYRSAAGVLTTDDNFTIGSITNNSRLNIGVNTDTTAAGGITFGTDANLYRSTTNTLKTDDNFIIAGTLTVGTLVFPSADNTAGTVLTTDGAGALYWGAGGGGGGGGAAVVVQDSGSYAVLSGDVGKMFKNSSASACTYTLPTAAGNLNYLFYVDNGQLNITAAAGDQIRIFNALSSVAGTVSSVDVGSAVQLIAMDATTWVATYVTGIWSV